MARVLVAAVALPVALSGLMACSDGREGGGPGTGTDATGASTAPAQPAVLVDQIAPAAAALEAQLGGPQRYTGINATPSEVNLFVADATGGAAGWSESGWVYRDGTLEPPTPPRAIAADSPTFSLSEVAFDPEQVLVPLTGQLPGSYVLAFSIQPAASTGPPLLIADLVSSRGGGLRARLGPEGEILETQFAEQ